MHTSRAAPHLASSLHTLGSLLPARPERSALPCLHGTAAKTEIRPQMEEKRRMTQAGLEEERKQAAAAEAARLAAEKA